MQNGKNRAQRVALICGFAAVLGAGVANAQTDISSVITTLGTYNTAAMALGIIILLFVLGRAIVRKVAK